MSKVLLAAAVAAVSASAFATSTAQAELAFGIGGIGSSLVRFDTAAPAASTKVGDLTGIAPGYVLRSIDFRPATTELYGLAAGPAIGDGTLSSYQLYTINTSTAVATPVSAPVALSFALGTAVSIDFNPTVDRLRVVTGLGGNFRINPNNGALVDGNTNVDGVQPDGNLAYATGSATPLVAGVAYINNINGATTTTMYVWDYNNDGLSTVIPPNNGVMNLVGALDPNFISNFSPAVGFDVSRQTGIAYLSTQTSVTGPAVSSLYEVNLATGGVTLIDTFGSNFVTDISVVVPEPGAVGLLAFPALAALRRRR